jgi:hypothetical protein
MKAATTHEQLVDAGRLAPEHINGTMRRFDLVTSGLMIGM